MYMYVCAELASQPFTFSENVIPCKELVCEIFHCVFKNFVPHAEITNGHTLKV